MADPNESQRHRSDDADLPEVVDAEVVEVDRPASTPPPTVDDSDFREYQEFLQYQKFKEWQRQQGADGASPPPPSPPPSWQPQKKPWWKHALRLLRLLRFKLVRRLIYLVILLFLLSSLYDSWTGGSDDEYQPGQPPPPQPQPVLQTEPKEAIIAVYDYVATKPGSVCPLFSGEGRRAFASSFQAPDCDTAVRKLHDQVTEPMVFKNPRFGENTVQIYRAEAKVDACLISVEGGPNLGTFGLRKEGNGGWVISDHAPPAC